MHYIPGPLNNLFGMTSELMAISAYNFKGKLLCLVSRVLLFETGLFTVVTSIP